MSKFYLPVLAFFILGIGLGSTSAQASTSVQPVRAVHIIINQLSIDDMKRQADMAQLAGFNTMILDLGNKIAFNNFPGPISKSAWSVAELVEVVSYIRRKGMQVIPGVPLLSHQWQFLAKPHPELMFDASTYDPSKPNVYNLVFPYLDEVIATIHPKAMHIGHDEVSVKLPADYFLQDVNLIHDYLAKKNVKTWMWGDMLISRDEFPTMFPEILNGNENGYGRKLREKIPKDIVIGDWHYWDTRSDFPSLAAFHASGFQVLGATWRKTKTTQNFSRYAAAHGAEGMIVTTWFDPEEPLVVHTWDELNKIIQEAGAAFNKDFPDAK